MNYEQKIEAGRLQLPEEALNRARCVVNGTFNGLASIDRMLTPVISQSPEVNRYQQQRQQDAVAIQAAEQDYAGNRAMIEARLAVQAAHNDLQSAGIN